MKRKLSYLLTALLLSIFAVQCDDSISNSGSPEQPPEENQEDLEKPELLSPSNGAINQSVTVSLTWKKIRGGKEYKIQISETEDFDSLLVEDVTEGTSYQAENLTLDKIYFWKVQPIKNNKLGPWSDVWHFTTASDEIDPVTVDLVSPENEAHVPYQNVSFSWSAAEDAEKYHFQLSADAEFTQALEDTVVQSTSVEIAELGASDEFFWRVSPILDSAPSEWSEIRQISTESKQNEPPSETVTVDLISPEHEAEVSYQNVVFAWNEVSEVSEYHYQLATDSEFNETIEEAIVDSTSIEITELGSNTDYFWRVSPVADSPQTEWSDVWQITTTAQPTTPAATLVSPADGSSDNPETVTFEWEQINGVTDYQLQVSTDDTFTSTFADELVSGTTFEVSGLDNSQIYYWRVQATGDNNPDNWSATWSFETEAEKAPPSETGSFVSTQNGDFYVDGETFRYAGTNAYYLPVYKNIDPSVVDRAFDAFQEANISVVRMWAFYDGPAEWDGDAPLQPRAGEYSEENLRLLDQVIAQGKQQGVRFILTLVNYYPELGGICQYNKWAGVPESQACDSNGSSFELFMKGSTQQDLYKKYINMLLNRVNTETGIAYKDEPAIFSWEIINEGRNPGGDTQEMRDWYQEIARYIKSIDPNHMVSTGEEGFETGEPSEYSLDQYSNTYILRSNQGTSYMLNTAIPEIDYGSAHWYPNGWGWSSASDQQILNAQRAWMSDHARIAEDLGKPFLLGEYGYSGWGDSRTLTIYGDLWKHAESIQMDGSLLWQLTADYVKCYEYGGNICWPGGRGDAELYNGFINHIQAMDAQ